MLVWGTDLLMLARGLDSAAASLAQLSDTLTAAQKAREWEREEPVAKRPCGGSTEFTCLDAGKEAGEGSGNSVAADALPRGETNGDVRGSAEVAQSTNLKLVCNLAVFMAGRAANLARELKTIKSELRFMKERCGLLEEENKRLRDGYDNGGAAPEGDDMKFGESEAEAPDRPFLPQDPAPAPLLPLHPSLGNSGCSAE